MLLNDPTPLGLASCKLQVMRGMGKVWHAEGTVHAKACGCWSPGRDGEDRLWDEARAAGIGAGSELTGILNLLPLVLG